MTSPGYGNAEDKALYVLSSLAVSPQEKEAIERATVGQTKNAMVHAKIVSIDFRCTVLTSFFSISAGNMDYMDKMHLCCKWHEVNLLFFTGRHIARKESQLPTSVWCWQQ